MTEATPEKRYDDKGSEVQANSPDYNQAAPAPEQYATGGELVDTSTDADEDNE